MSKPEIRLHRARIHVPGVVQGIGFRPKMYRLATGLGLTGFVRNSPAGAELELQGRLRSEAECVLETLRRSGHHCSVEWLPPVADERAFRIDVSLRKGSARPVLSPDVRICDACASELRDTSSRRYGYGLISCAECGPRQSLARALPFDRDTTSWSRYPRCQACEAEYVNPADRRFHAQTISCPDCGPSIHLTNLQGALLAASRDAVHAAAELLREGGILALKGVGGYHLVVDARSERAVQELRRRKRREAKPLAVLVRTVDEATCLGNFSREELVALTSAAAPIVLVDKTAGARTTLASGIAPGLNRVGLFLAYAPLQLLLLDALAGPVVATSGNRSEEPICANVAEAHERLAGIADAFLEHDLDIVSPQDDSVVQLIAERLVTLRRARGYPIRLEPIPNLTQPTVAAGADLKSAVASADAGQLVLGPHLGQLGLLETNELHSRQLRELPALLGARPQCAVFDLHPDYRSSRAALELGADAGLGTQHHCAHVASVIYEHALYERVVLGFAWDGTGHGLDGTSWGGEAFTFSKKSISRVASLRPIPMPGGDAAAREPRRVAFALAREAGISITSLDWLGDRRELAAWDALRPTAPRCSSIGRLFDGVSALLGLCTRASYEGQAAMFLQDLAEQCAESPLPALAASGNQEDGVFRWDWRGLIPELLAWRDERSGRRGFAARAFHLLLVEWLVGTARTERERCGVSDIVLTGGVFQNKLLLETAIQRLRGLGFNAWWNENIPPNDGGIAIGQIVCASEYQDALKKFQEPTP